MTTHSFSNTESIEKQSILDRRISDYLAHYAKATPAAEAVVFSGDRVSYADLERRVAACAKALLAAGIAKGDRVACLANPSPEYWVTFLATTRVGAVWLGLNPKYQLDELRYVIGDAAPRLVFAICRFEGRDYRDIIRQLWAEHESIETVVSLRESIDGATPYVDFIESGEGVGDENLAVRESSVERMDPALLVYTSGSTGRPKGALLSHHGLSYGAEVQNRHFRLERSKMLCAFPINHVACVADTCCVSLVSGGSLVFHEAFDPGAFLKDIEAEKITCLGGVPTMLLMILEHPDFDRTDLSSLEIIAWGGAALPIPIIEKLQSLGPRLKSVYGLTETAANVTFTDHDADLVQLSETVGRPDPDMPCRIMNDEGQECGAGEAGELQFKGDFLLLEYLNKPEATKDVYTEDKWLKTGDIGYWREDGTITLVGRKSDIFKSGGYNVYPKEIEIFLEQHSQVEMAAVVSVPDPLYQEVGAAFVIPAKGAVDAPLTEGALREFCKTGLANYKIPKSFRLVPTLPILPVGKVDKVALKEKARAELES